MWTLLACRDPGPGPDDSGTATGPVTVIPHEAGGTVALLGAPGDTVAVDGADDHRTVTLDDDGHAELVGLLGDVVYTFRGAGGPSTARLQGPSADDCPTIDVLAHDPERMGPGWLLVPFRPLTGTGSCTVLYDEALRPRWWFLSDAFSVEDAVFGPDGNVWLRTSQDEVDVRTIRGEPVAHYAAEPMDGALPLPLGPDGHEFVPNADGSFWAFGQRGTPFQVPDAPGAATSHEATVDDTPIQLVAADGSLLREVDLLSTLQPGRCGFDCLLEWPFGLDFLHGNAFVPLPDGGIVAAMRNQDLVERLDADGDVVWRFGDPEAGWVSPWRETFLTPVGDVDWPYHHHGLDYDPATGTLLVFDNHAWGGTPWGADPEDLTSRVGLFRVDEVAGTVEQTASWRTTTTGTLQSTIMGDADLPRIPGAPFLAVFAWLRGENGVDNPSRGWGSLTSRIVAFDPEDPEHPPLDLRLRLPLGAFPDGGYAYRAHLVAPLVP